MRVLVACIGCVVKRGQFYAQWPTESNDLMAIAGERESESGFAI